MGTAMLSTDYIPEPTYLIEIHMYKSEEYGMTELHLTKWNLWELWEQLRLSARETSETQGTLDKKRRQVVSL